MSLPMRFQGSRVLRARCTISPDPPALVLDAAAGSGHDASHVIGRDELPPSLKPGLLVHRAVAKWWPRFGFGCFRVRRLPGTGFGSQSTVLSRHPSN